MLALLILAVSFWASRLGVREPMGPGRPNNTGPHGLSEILYAYSSGTGNNGSAFAGLTANTPWYDTTLGLAMLIGRVHHDHPDHGTGRLARAKEDRASQRRDVPASAAARLSSCCWRAPCC